MSLCVGAEAVQGSRIVSVTLLRRRSLLKEFTASTTTKEHLGEDQGELIKTGGTLKGMVVGRLSGADSGAWSEYCSDIGAMRKGGERQERVDAGYVIEH